MKSAPTRVLDADAVAAIVANVGLGTLYDLAIERLTRVLTAETPSHVEMKERDGFTLTWPQLGLLEWMPAVRHGATVSIKMVGYNPHNPSKFQLPTILSTLYAFDSESGHLRTIVDGTFATAIRTGAASVVASRILARSDSSVLGLVGCGVQAVTQLHALARAFPLTEVLIHDPLLHAEAGFAARARFPSGVIRVAPLAEVERLADILCTTTSVMPEQGPVIDGTALKPSVHINAVGSDMPGKTELPLALLRGSVVCPDQTEQALAEGECQQLDVDEIGPSLGDLLQDPEKHAGLKEVRTVYDSTGLALQDLVMAELFEELAAQAGIGHDIYLESSAGDPYDPYSFLPPEAVRFVPAPRQV
ncbi:ornithine cyclodeaminase family protein [Lentzea guizhouensis]|uniref:ornithine cyclodeaminase family protein n=1 Tax=Lentzea guizhouensis TaxID=1586287 RepID=UPI000A887753|nr:ornithine cyclodeaminase family protein [Lentzea guizhouensis]